MKKESNFTILKGIVITYIAVNVLLATGNSIFPDLLGEDLAGLLHLILSLVENPGKILLILAGAALSISYYRKSRQIKHHNRKTILISFILAAFTIHLILPLLLRSFYVYLYTMPLPWITSGLQLMVNGTMLGDPFISAYGDIGLALMLALFWIYNIITFIMAVILGRRFQCSQICLFNGFMSEVIDPVLPLLGKKKPVPVVIVRITSFLRPFMLVAGLFFTLYWTVCLVQPDWLPGTWQPVLYKMEVYKYLAFDLLFMIVTWIVWGPRTYCAYCSAGTAVGIVARFVGRQSIQTDITHCTSCTLCNRVCPMHLKPMDAAQNKVPLRSIQCTGCRRCEEICPTGNLRYGTAATRLLKERT
jgi:ferredoxin-type protein NapH